MGISIHAPVKGATTSLANWLSSLDISIHAPVKGATIHTQYPVWEIRISIHAPVKGATRPDPGGRGRAGDFNPRTREGCDGIAAASRSASDEFQSTHP